MPGLVIGNIAILFYPKVSSIQSALLKYSHDDLVIARFIRL